MKDHIQGCCKATLFSNWWFQDILITRNNNNVLEELTILLEALKHGERNVFKLLDTPEDFFEEAPFEQLFSNEDDVLHGLNRIQRDFDGFYFGVFTRAIIKYFDNGKIEIELLAQTHDAEKVISFSNNLIERFKDEMFKNNKQPMFCDKARIVQFCEGKTGTAPTKIIDVWNAYGLTFKLVYTNAAPNVFGFIITIEPEKIVDMSVRRKGTILDLLDFDIDLTLAIGETYGPEEIDSNNQDFVDYTYLLNKKQLGLFDVLKIRIFDQQRTFRKEVRTNIFLSSSERLEFNDMLPLVEKLHRLYGTDHTGAAEVEYWEREVFDLFGMFFGRCWTFNHAHGLWDKNIEAEDISYEVDLNNFNNEGELVLTILFYNDLVSLFGQV